MRILLDTNVAIWSVCDTDKIPDSALELISDVNNDVFISLVSVWEIAIKNISKPNKIPINEKDFIRYCYKLGFQFLPMKLNHIISLRYLKLKKRDFVHKDPFDNIIVAQSISEGIELLTSDKLLSNYDHDNITIIDKMV